jgi:FlaA1/EpsC-like NDP-sugar epimerase
MACQAVQAQRSATRFVMVRFGNVLGSSGSVIPRFREQIAKGGPVTVTHPEIIRYFMLIPEAAQLVLQAGLMAAQESEGGRIFVLDMGEPVRIVDLARDMIRLSGFADGEIKIEFSGLRPGEKLFEELLADGESTLPTPHPKLRIAKPSAAPDQQWLADLEQWLAAAGRDEAEVKEGLRQRIPEYRPATH